MPLPAKPNGGFGQWNETPRPMPLKSAMVQSQTF